MVLPTECCDPRKPSQVSQLVFPSGWLTENSATRVQQVAHAILTTDVHVQGPLLLVSSQSQSQSQVSPPSPRKKRPVENVHQVKLEHFSYSFSRWKCRQHSSSSMQHATCKQQPATSNLQLATRLSDDVFMLNCKLINVVA